MEEKLKTIEGFPDYYISNLGNVYSKKRGALKKLKPWLDGKKRYLMITLVNENGFHKKMLIHKLVAKAFIPNPDNLPEVNHKDKNTQNPKSENLEWCTRKDNLYDSYSTMSPIRNFNSCKLYKGDKFVDEFQSIREASEYAASYYGAKKYSLEKYLRCGDIHIEPNNTSREGLYDGKIHSTQNRNPIKLYDGELYIGTFKSYREIQEYLYDNHNITISDTSLRKYKKCKNFRLVRDEKVS